jgi:hypothetical protein
MSYPVVERHPAPDRRKRRRYVTTSPNWLIMAGATGVALVISLAAFLAISYYVL